MDDPYWYIRSESTDKIPKLAWLACAPIDGGQVDITHGTLVEVADGWIVEGCWDAPFSEGNFHLSENFFGSGVRITENTIYFCSSMSLTDRLVYARHDRQVIVSNSLILLLSKTGANLDLKHDYYDECYGSLKGILKYPKKFHVIHPEIVSFYQVFSANLILHADGLQQVPRSHARHFEQYEQYISKLRQTLTAISDNSACACRHHPMRTYTTLSSGYDSAAVTCLANDIGVSTCFTTSPGSTSKSRHMEDGKRIADRLAMKSVLLDPEDAGVSENEVYFLAPTYEGCEVIFDRMARYIEAEDQPAVVMTGYHGDKIWDRSTSGKYLDDEIIRGDTSGLNLSEIRLKSGFINLAVPFLFSRSARDIVGISNLPEMRSWQTNTDYDRPIPRRIAESHDIPGQWFGQKKKAILSYYSKPINRDLRREFMAFLKSEVSINSPMLLLYEATEMFDYFNSRVLARLMPHKRIKEVPWSLRRFVFQNKLNFRLLMFIWACTYLQEKLTLESSSRDR